MTSQAEQHRTLMQKAARVLPLFTVLFCMLFFLRNAQLAKDAVLEGLRRAALGILPSVFPFLVLSDLLTSIGGLPKWMSLVLSRLLKLPNAACSAILLGWVCGFPIGARYAVQELQQGRLTQKETERTVAAASIPSPAFLIGAVGGGMLQNTGAGVALWLVSLLSAFTVCFCEGIFQKKVPKKSEKATPFPHQPFVVSLTNAVSNAAITALYLCAFVVFFTVVASAVSAVLERFGAPTLLHLVTVLLLEISTGVSKIANLTDGTRALLLCGAACGWSGFSVHFQIASICGVGLQMRRYLLAKVAQALLCVIFLWLWTLLQK